MPELPEVETTLQGLKPYLEGVVIHDVIVRRPKLRWPIPENFKQKLIQQRVQRLSRRGKYLLIDLNESTIIIHLGMSGRLRVLTDYELPKLHDHVDIVFSEHLVLRYTDPRRFGAIIWTDKNPLEHPLLQKLGVEPLDAAFTSDYLFQKASCHRVPIKSLIMDSKIVVGIGNIYATEALFLACLHPITPACLLTKEQCQQVVKSIKQVLKEAIKQGGTTLKDFVNGEGKPGYFSQQLKVYGRKGLSCVRCKVALQSFILRQRSTVYCANCQSKHDSII